ncbi:PEP-CTERM sorting domain-containing protein [Coraliomargarita sp. W4R53]
MKTKLLPLIAVATSISTLTVSAFSDNFSRADADPAGAPWSIGNAANIEIANNQLAWTTPPTPSVVGVDLSSEGLDSGFTVSVDFTFTQNDWVGIWAMGDETDGTSGYVFRVKTTDGFMQATNYSSGTSVNTGGWTNSSATFSALSANTEYRMTVTGTEDATGGGGTFVFSIDNISGTEAVSVGSITAIRGSGFSNPATGNTFGIYGQGSNPTFDNFTATVPEPSTYALIGGCAALAFATCRRRRPQAS